MTTTQQALDDFLIDCEARGLSVKTLSYYQQQVGKLVTWLTQQGVMELETVSTDDLRRYLVHLKKSGIAPASQHAGARAVRAWLNWCEKMDMLPGKNPIAKLTMPKRSQTIKPAVSMADVKKLLEACEGAKDPSASGRSCWCWWTPASGPRSCAGCASATWSALGCSCDMAKGTRRGRCSSEM